MPAEREKDSGAALAVMEGCLHAAWEGLAVLVPMHTRKGHEHPGNRKQLLAQQSRHLRARPAQRRARSSRRPRLEQTAGVVKWRSRRTSAA